MTYDPYRIDSIAEIDQILLDIIKQGALVRMHAGNPDSAVITTLISIDFDNELLIIDSAPQQSVNLQLTEAEKAYFETNINQVSIKFQISALHETTYEDRPALAGPIPAFIRRIQRRNNFRIQPATTNPVTCTFTIDDHKIQVSIFDISANGLSFLDNNEELVDHDLHKGRIIDNSQLSLPNIGTLTVGLQLVRTQSQRMASGKVFTRYGGTFFQLTAADQIKIQNYIDREERQRIARERGLA